MNTKGEIRKHYEKPQVSQIKLEIEETVLAACKSNTAGGKNSTPCRIGTGNKYCKTVLGS